MRTGSRVRGGLGLRFVAAVAIVLAAGLALAGEAAAQEVDIGRATVAQGSQATVSLQALDIGAPGLGAWEIGVIYDPSVVSAVSCSPQSGSVCNAAFGSSEVRVVGASGAGRQGDSTLASITFRCDAEGTSPLTLNVVEFANSTIGSPQDISAQINGGSIVCTEPGSAPPGPPDGDGVDDTTEEPAPTTTTPAVSGLPESGSGSGGSGGLGWLIATLAAIGIASLAGSTILASRRS